MSSHSKIELSPKNDANGATYHVGNMQAPLKMSFKKGVVFLVYLSEESCEELHIGCARPGAQFDPIKKRLNKDGSVDRYIVRLERREDKNNQTFFIGLVQDDNLELDFENGFGFFVFSSKLGKEEIHLSRSKENFKDAGRSIQPDPEIVRYNPHYDFPSLTYGGDENYS